MEVSLMSVSEGAGTAEYAGGQPQISPAEREAGGIFLLNLALGDHTFASQGGRTAQLAQGDFAIVDGAQPFELGPGLASLTIPRELLAPLAAPGEVTAIRVRGDRGVGAVASSALQALARLGSSLDTRAAALLADQIAGLIALALGGAYEPAVPTRRAPLLQGALEEVERSLDDPELSPAQIAERVGISTRYLHRLFSERGPSFGRWVLTRRLQRCREDLADPRRAHWTIGEIAHGRGFRDSSYFAKAFKARYGVSPRELRRAAAGA
jgi:AraC family transcriptional regulator, positive regulator of tynA and feaB